VGPRLADTARWRCPPVLPRSPESGVRNEGTSTVLRIRRSGTVQRFGNGNRAARRADHHRNLAQLFRVRPPCRGHGFRSRMQKRTPVRASPGAASRARKLGVLGPGRPTRLPCVSSGPEGGARRCDPKPMLTDGDLRSRRGACRVADPDVHAQRTCRAGGERHGLGRRDRAATK